MKIAFLSKDYSPDLIGGVGIYIGENFSDITSKKEAPFNYKKVCVYCNSSCCIESAR